MGKLRGLALTQAALSRAVQSIPTYRLPPTTCQLEYVLQPQLNLPGRLIAVFICRLHDAERRRVEGSARKIKVWNIEKVKELKADFKSSAFVPERDLLQHRKVEVVESRPQQDVSTLSPQEGVQRAGKGTGIEPAIRGVNLVWG